MRGVFVGAIASCVLAACNTTPNMDIPTVEPAALPAAASITDTRPFMFVKAVSGIRFGTTIAHFPAGGVKGASGTLCNAKHQGESTIVWTASSRYMSGWNDDVGTIFHDVMSQRGFDLAGDPDQLFGTQESLSRAEFQIGARVEEMRGNYCQEHHWWDGRPLDKYSGEMYMRIQWGVFDVVDEREVATLETEGYALQATPTSTGIMDAFLASFAAATEELASHPDFLAAISKSGANPGILAEGPLRDEVLILDGVPLSSSPFKDNVLSINPSVVTLQAGSGHGTGFIVSEDGLILTNHHVVGERRVMNVVFQNGLEVQGEVVRKHKSRDVALVKVPLSGLRPLAINPELPSVADRVFVIGTPAHRHLSNTVTTGVVSAIRLDGPPDNPFMTIQADAAIHGGNSGGPLFDEFGNVIGITFAVSTSGGSASNQLGLFIPIASGMDYLNIKVGGAAGS